LSSRSERSDPLSPSTTPPAALPTRGGLSRLRRNFLESWLNYVRARYKARAAPGAGDRPALLQDPHPANRPGASWAKASSGRSRSLGDARTRARAQKRAARGWTPLDRADLTTAIEGPRHLGRNEPGRRQRAAALLAGNEAIAARLRQLGDPLRGIHLRESLQCTTKTGQWRSSRV
jgi:hypothetical protein